MCERAARQGSRGSSRSSGSGSGSRLPQLGSGRSSREQTPPRRAGLDVHTKVQVDLGSLSDRLSGLASPGAAEDGQAPSALDSVLGTRPFACSQSNERH